MIDRELTALKHIQENWSKIRKWTLVWTNTKFTRN